MKVRVKKTDNIEHVVSINTTWQNFLPINEVEFIQDETPAKDIDWEQRRFELIKTALQGFCANNHPRCVDAHTSELANWSIGAANAVIEKLKAE